MVEEKTIPNPSRMKQTYFEYLLTHSFSASSQHSKVLCGGQGGKGSMIQHHRCQGFSQRNGKATEQLWKEHGAAGDLTYPQKLILES